MLPDPEPAEASALPQQQPTQKPSGMETERRRIKLKRRKDNRSLSIEYGFFRWHLSVIYSKLGFSLLVVLKEAFIGSEVMTII